MYTSQTLTFKSDKITTELNDEVMMDWEHPLMSASAAYITEGGGDILYLSTVAGKATSTAPSGNGDIVRVVGYCLDASNGQIYFNPDNTFVEVSA